MLLLCPAQVASKRQLRDLKQRNPVHNRMSQWFTVFLLLFTAHLYVCQVHQRFPPLAAVRPGF
jgi:hypothetical protein